MSETSTLISCTGRITRVALAKLPTPPATETRIPIPHAAVVQTLVETLSHRHIGVVGEEFAVSKDDMEMFGVLDLETTFEGCRFAIGIRNANNKRFRLACTVGLRVFVCHSLAFRGDYSPVLAKHSKRFLLEDAMSIGVDRMQRNFEPMWRQVESWRAQQLSSEAAKLTIYPAFVEGDLEVPRHLARRVHELYFNPQHEEFQPRTMWSCRTRSPRPSRNSIRSRNFGRRPNWEVFSKAPLRHDRESSLLEQRAVSNGSLKKGTAERA